VIDLLKALVLGGKERPPGDDPEAGLLATGDEVLGRIALHVHGADHDHIGPRQVFRSQVAHVGVDQALLPRLWQHGGDSQQAQGLVSGFFADKAQGVLETPKRIRELGVNQ